MKSGLVLFPAVPFVFTAARGVHFLLFARLLTCVCFLFWSVCLLVGPFLFFFVSASIE